MDFLQNIIKTIHEKHKTFCLAFFFHANPDVTIWYRKKSSLQPYLTLSDVIRLARLLM